MSTELPMACTLTPAELPARVAEMAAVGRDALEAAEVRDREAVLRFRVTGDTRERLAAIVAAEARCCAFLDMDLRHDAGRLVLTVGAPAGAEPVLDGLVAAFRGTAERAS
jgi:hypothetical protein